ncbi:MAG: protocatechuate 3,4-dioxygenase subunit alpha [Brevibacterium yomogidense]|uniref:protocatechuate 3,4-dioxygenase subunit alpha n=1 Tax=Brevibacterium sp. Mu109 TaxID=1255669 RepID=UPI000C64D711|nr:protocatechuate 3,4-dioxygenase subunit alpha [Brevibacterium sp. Mu109]SMX78692.1 protocatechuate 3,4-dioxygenase alpha subunit [Brevibacterium sp. Mu109]
MSDMTSSTAAGTADRAAASGRYTGADLTTGDLVPTPAQTIGPFYGFALEYEHGNELVPVGSARAVRLHGTVTDGAGTPVPDALLEIWQADESGAIPDVEGSLLRDGFTFTGFGREGTDGSGNFTLSTVDPGPTQPGSAPFISLCVFARGLLNRLFTRIYLPEDEAALAADPLLSQLPADRRKTLIATREEDGSLRFDVRLQGDDETVFLKFPRNDDF